MRAERLRLVGDPNLVKQLQRARVDDQRARLVQRRRHSAVDHAHAEAEAQQLARQREAGRAGAPPPARPRPPLALALSSPARRGPFILPVCASHRAQARG